jgi:hypothetical protein
MIGEQASASAQYLPGGVVMRVGGPAGTAMLLKKLARIELPETLPISTSP